jgi:hypothetical protein
MQHLKAFMLSEGGRYQDLLPASADVAPRSSADALAEGLDGWSFMMRTADRTLAFLYFETNAVAARLGGFTPSRGYRWSWFDPRSGTWSEPTLLAADAHGTLVTPDFPDGGAIAGRDIAAKVSTGP